MNLSKTLRLRGIFLHILLTCAFQGAHCELTVSPAGPTLVNAVAGTNVTLAVSFSGAPDPTLFWFMEDLPVLRWIPNSALLPVIAVNRAEVLSIEKDGSLTFVNVPSEYSSNYTLEVLSRFGKVSTVFELRVFEIIQNVTLSTEPYLAIEGTERFTLHYNMTQGVIEEQKWFFNDVEIKTNSHYLIEQKSLVIFKLTRRDAGLYSVSLTNPFSSVTPHINLTVLYGPDEPVLEAHPVKLFYTVGDSLNLSCQAEGFPPPIVQWVFDGQNISDRGLLDFTNIQTTQGGVYMCNMLNNLTNKKSQKNMTLNVYERPPGIPQCSVQSGNNNTDLQYHCRWPRGTPEAQLYFPELSDSSRGEGNFSLTVTASDSLDGKVVTCTANYPGSPVKFLTFVKTKVSREGKIVVTIHCVSEASPSAVVLWSKGNETITNGTMYRISSNTTQLEMRDYNISNFLLQSYTCTCSNPLGSQRRDPRLSGLSSFYPHEAMITMTWECSSTCGDKGGSLYSLLVLPLFVGLACFIKKKTG